MTRPDSDASAVPRAALHRRTLRVLMLSQVLSGVGMAAGIAVGALLAQEMLGSTGSAGLPTALFTAGSALAALLVGRISQRHGRRRGLATGYAVGAAGGATVVLAAAIDSVPLLFAALVLYGSGLATTLQARYAGGDLAAPENRARAMSTVLLATTLGAVAGPNLTGPMGTLADAIGLPTLSGPFLLATLAYAAAGATVALLLRPDPLLTARRWAAADAAAPGAGPTVARSARQEAASRRTLMLAGAAMVVTQTVMVAIMTMTPIHMHDHGHGLAASGLVISLHIAAMYLPSPLSGQLVDRHGPRAVLAGAGLVLLAAGVVAAVAPPQSTATLAVGLVLLGFGWSLGLAAGTAMVTDAAPLERRARTQGAVDVSIAVAGATGGLASGYVVASSSYPTLAVVGGVLGLLLLPLTTRIGATRR